MAATASAPTVTAACQPDAQPTGTKPNAEKQRQQQRRRRRAQPNRSAAGRGRRVRSATVYAEEAGKEVRPGSADRPTVAVGRARDRANQWTDRTGDGRPPPQRAPITPDAGLPARRPAPLWPALVGCASAGLRAGICLPPFLPATTSPSMTYRDIVRVLYAMAPFRHAAGAAAAAAADTVVVVVVAAAAAAAIAAPMLPPLLLQLLLLMPIPLSNDRCCCRCCRCCCGMVAAAMAAAVIADSANILLQ